jgi:hypothetical protein
MAAEPQDAPRHAGRVVRRVLLRRNIAVDTETAQIVAAARALRSPAASRCSDPASAVPVAGQAPGPGRARRGAGLDDDWLELPGGGQQLSIEPAQLAEPSGRARAEFARPSPGRAPTVTFVPLLSAAPGRPKNG